MRLGAEDYLWGLLAAYRVGDQHSMPLNGSLAEHVPQACAAEQTDRPAATCIPGPLGLRPRLTRFFQQAFQAGKALALVQLASPPTRRRNFRGKTVQAGVQPQPGHPRSVATTASMGQGHAGIGHVAHPDEGGRAQPARNLFTAQAVQSSVVLCRRPSCSSACFDEASKVGNGQRMGAGFMATVATLSAHGISGSLSTVLSLVSHHQTAIARDAVSMS